MKVKEIIEMFRNSTVNFGFSFKEDAIIDDIVYDDLDLNKFAIDIDGYFIEEDEEVDEEYLNKEGKFEALNFLTDFKIETLDNNEYTGKVRKNTMLLVISIVE